ncbi:SAM-dependent methyltransferase [Mesorhizobium atlanticum]
MTDELDRVRDHYRATGLTDRLRTALAIFGPEEDRLKPEQLATLDQFHTRGLAATAELANLAVITADMSVLDVGSGAGGPARFLEATYGCRVTGVDLSEPFVEAARYLTARTGQDGKVSFETGNALALPPGWHVRCSAFAARGDEHRRPVAALPRGQARAEAGRKIRHLRRRAE